jgi:uncharacterized membrane protein (UPF0127 family)
MVRAISCSDLRTQGAFRRPAERLVRLDLGPVLPAYVRGESEPMKRERIQRVVREDGSALCDRCFVADTPLTRMRGLLGRPPLQPGEGLLLRPASAIHTWFMRFPIDALFLNRDLVVTAVAEDIRPWRMLARRRSRSVLELASGETQRRGIRSGERLRLAEARATEG